MNLNEKWVGEEMRGVEVGEIIFSLFFWEKNQCLIKGGKGKYPIQVQVHEQMTLVGLHVGAWLTENQITTFISLF